MKETNKLVEDRNKLIDTLKLIIGNNNLTLAGLRKIAKEALDKINNNN